MNIPSLRHPFCGKLIIIGFGAIARATLPLLLRHLTLDRKRVTIISPEILPTTASDTVGQLHRLALTEANYIQVLSPLLEPGDLVLNLSVGVCSCDIIQLAQSRGAHYLDTGIEPWDAATYYDADLTPSQRSNYALREQILALKGGRGATAVVTHGANPGMANHLLKQALLELAAHRNPQIVVSPRSRSEWATLAHQLGVRTVHIAEQDSQTTSFPVSPYEFVNTWSVDGFLAEACQPAEIGWGTHETALPEMGCRHENGCQAAILLNRSGASVRVRSWTPFFGPFHGFLITHGEVISLADYFTLREERTVFYRPTVHYAYRPCDAALISLHNAAGRAWDEPVRKRVLIDEVSSGMDALGVLLAGHADNAFWYGTSLTVETARGLAPYNNATSLQVAAGILSGICWILDNPARGVVEPEDMDHDSVLAYAAPYLGERRGAYTDWTPLTGRKGLFAESVDRSDPWQFSNVQV